MARRLPSTPPNLPGFSYLRVLGSGGFADVFLYEQNMPRRQVAVKVLLAEIVNDHVRQLFQAEANLMAQLSSHPSILTVFQASVSADGRPYLVMEYCSSTLSQSYRVEALSVPETLRVGIKIASAVETAHRAGVLHRDLKPSNILVTAYGHPVLSDFGIAATLGEAENSDAIGLSIPWSAPEVLLNEISGSVASEVWSLGATLYSLLAGRSPFELPGADNGSAQIMGRIQKAGIPPLNRTDVPGRLELILARAMSRRPELRQPSVLELIRELQSVEAELGLAQTRLEVAVDDWATSTLADQDDKTRITAINSIDAYAGRRRRKPVPAGAAPRSTTRAGTGSGTPGDTVTTLPRTRKRALTLVALLTAAVLILGLAATAVAFLMRDSGNAIPGVSDVSGELRNGTVVFSWPDPGVRDGDNFVVALRTGESSIQRGTEFAVDPQGEERVCATVSVSRDGQAGTPSGEKCVDTTGGGP
ncbi:serine/threonine protein kinase [Cryobacterium sp. TMT1-21]|uniref:non-specific serine/threonine protein kinase n=1 Tax=Cryobacterium shii TaxID=1259235 RepID=A0AAQ2C769_9MICO|nr:MULTISPECIES: serine/threonine-protein kinase [Cryobacterium]TFC50128.1 serine/threonine protein kinase [Cryobacterium shii]TFC82479.1 serine/threonine protein kinase [Cryobacterium sp. TmT2-59]TFD12174.1 serine/threonine protein kinase [Cryobacterium sp. TMT1-21]TFD19673.1 serine/threonine protein kinase [Cryobacterium sp. TMT4-10]TFD20626.1 serine/threonine protein kinase [Cryobacterium sp. TMT2-23]